MEENKSLLFAIGIGAVVGICVFILVFFMILNSNNKKQIQQQPPQVQTTPDVEDDDLARDEEDEEEEEQFMVIGAKNYGYVKLPSDWTEIYESGGTHALQYSYRGRYTIKLDYYQSDKDAKTLASEYGSSEKAKGEQKDVTGATVKLGQNEEFTAYQVYGYYENIDSYKITYWFDGTDKLVHYISLEGPKELDDYKITSFTYIPKSFSLTKITE